MNAIQYLSIPDEFSSAHDDTCWAYAGDALVDQIGTIMLTEQLDLVLQGVFSTYPKVPHFVHVVWLIRACVRGDQRIAPLHRAFTSVAGPEKSRNLGVLIGALCRGLAGV